MTKMSTISLPVALKQRISKLGRHKETYYQVLKRILDEYEDLLATKKCET